MFIVCFTHDVTTQPLKANKCLRTAVITRKNMGCTWKYCRTKSKHCAFLCQLTSHRFRNQSRRALIHDASMFCSFFHSPGMEHRLAYRLVSWGYIPCPPKILCPQTTTIGSFRILLGKAPLVSEFSGSFQLTTLST